MSALTETTCPPAAPARTPIRPLELSDIAQVANLYERVIRSGGDLAPPGLAEYFRRIFFAPENSDPELPSLVYEDADGSIAGFLGVYAREMQWDGQPIRMACSGQLITRPAVRTKLAGIALLRAFLDGPQDLSINDGATADVGRIWERLGGRISTLNSLRWTKLLRPAAFAGDYVARRKMFRPAAFAARPLLRMTDAVLRRGTTFRKPSVENENSVEPLTAAAMAELWPKFNTGRRLRPVYRSSYVDWLLGEMHRVSARGPLVAMQVSRGSRPVGWYLYYLSPSEMAEAVQIAFAPGHAGTVVDALFADAGRRGAIAVQGRLEAGLSEPLARHGAFLQYREPLALVHSRRPELLAAIQSEQAFLTRADGEWWTGFHLQPLV